MLNSDCQERSAKLSKKQYPPGNPIQSLKQLPPKIGMLVQWLNQLLSLM